MIGERDLEAFKHEGFRISIAGDDEVEVLLGHGTFESSVVSVVNEVAFKIFLQKEGTSLLDLFFHFEEKHAKLVVAERLLYGFHISDDFVELSSFQNHSRPVLKLVCGGCSFGQILCIVHVLYLLPQIIIDYLRFSIGYLVKEDGLLVYLSIHWSVINFCANELAQPFYSFNHNQATLGFDSSCFGKLESF